jgi:ribosomal protein S18 acetylase RimI-like enzyme
MEIRTATRTDAKKISEIIRSLSQSFFIFPDGRGAEGFLESISENAVAGYIGRDNIAYYVGEAQGEIVGAIALRDNKHLYHLFVSESCQGRQLGRQLWEHARAKAMSAGNQGEFTVNSSINAVPVYKAFGFEPTSEIKQVNGISFLPMATGPMTRRIDDIGLTFARAGAKPPLSK